MARTKNTQQKNGNGANLGFEAQLWQAAVKLRGVMDAAEYKHVALGLILLKYISDAFAERYSELEREAANRVATLARRPSPKTPSPLPTR